MRDEGWQAHLPIRRVACLVGLLSFVLGCSMRNARPNNRTPHSAVGSVQFVDVTQQAGIRFRHVNGAFGRKYYPETFGSGCAFLDFDNDGWLDILLLQGGALPNAKGLGLRVKGSQPAEDKGRPRPVERGEDAADPRSQPSTLNPQPLGNALYRNNGNGTFTDVTRGSGLDVPMYAMGCCVGDYDNDGKDDVYITCALGPSRLFHNEGNGKFRDVTALAGVDNQSQWGTSCAWLDYDRDGYLDLFVCNYVKYSLADDLKCSNGGIKVYCGPLVYEPESCRLYHNLSASGGNGTFRDVTKSAGIFKETGKSLGVVVWDFDEDGWLDIAVANDLTPNYLFHNVPNSQSHSPMRRFEEVGAEWGVAYGEDGTARSGMGIDVADYLNNGKPATFISNFSREPNSFFVREGAHHFSDLGFRTGMGEISLPYLGFGLFFFDYDNDGWKDAFVTNGHIEPDIEKFESPITYKQRALLFHNRRDGIFDEVAARAGKPLMRRRVGRGAAYGDYDNDGDLDILLTNNNGEAELLRNDGGNSGNWLQVELKGLGFRVKGSQQPSTLNPKPLGSNRNGIGALVTVTTGNMTQRDTVRSGSSYLSQSMLRLHFGLGKATEVDRVEVRWQSGRVDRRENVKANQRLHIAEGESEKRGKEP